VSDKVLTRLFGRATVERREVPAATGLVGVMYVPEWAFR
jgi:hypothetical protein